MLYQNSPFIIPALAGGYLVAIYLILTLVQQRFSCEDATRSRAKSPLK